MKGLQKLACPFGEQLCGQVSLASFVASGVKEHPAEHMHESITGAEIIVRGVRTYFARRTLIPLAGAPISL
jgi:hypothetical protein